MFGGTKKSDYLCNVNTKKKEKFGDLLLDIAKYIITAVILTSLFQGIEEWNWHVYVLCIISVVIIIWIGLDQFNDNKNKTNKKKKGK